MPARALRRPSRAPQVARPASDAPAPPAVSGSAESSVDPSDQADPAESPGPAESPDPVESTVPAESTDRPVVPARRPRPAPHRGRDRPGRAVRRTGAQETSAGGLVIRTVSGAAEAALIGRLDRSGRLRWSLPKGHVEPGETTEQTAVREVREETGITGRIVAPLGSLSYSFTVAGRRVHKRVHHFLMTAESGELSDADVEVTEVAWVPVRRLQRVLAYTAERRIAQRAARMLADTA